MQFKHSPLPEHSELTGSFCLLCGKLVAASLNPEILLILERLHECLPLEKQRAWQHRATAKTLAEEDRGKERGQKGSTVPGRTA
jgi:hypothetical protein